MLVNCSNGEYLNYQEFALFDGYVHFLPNLRLAQEEASWDNTTEQIMNIS